MKNKKMYIFTFTLLMLLISCSIVTAENINYNNLCANDGIGSAARIIGYIIIIAKWLVPLIIIVLGMVDFGKAVIASDEKAINKSASSLIRRIIAGLAVFFAPTIILAFLNLIQITGGIEETSRFNACTKCILNATKYCSID